MYTQAATTIKTARRVTAFTGAGISVESGIPPFRGKDGLWNKYNPIYFEIGYFRQHQIEAWQLLKKLFYETFEHAQPNAAHYALARMQQHGWLQTIITQNIDNLHQAAGCHEVYEFHGSTRELICLQCSAIYRAASIDLEKLPPLCARCSGLLKPDIIFFGEPIPELAHSKAFMESQQSDVFLVIGTTGEIVPASLIPTFAKQAGATIIEVNVEESSYTHSITDIFLQGKATEVMTRLLEALEIRSFT